MRSASRVVATSVALGLLLTGCASFPDQGNGGNAQSWQPQPKLTDAPGPQPNAPGSGSDMLQVAAGFQTSDLAFSADGTPGDTGNLQKLVDIKSQTVTLTKVGTVMIGDADAQLVGRLAVDSQQNKSAMTTAQTMRDQAEADWQSTSGVNQDEEAVHLVEFQNMYQANMKVMSVANALFDATLQMMG